MTTEDLVAVINVAVPDWYKHKRYISRPKHFKLCVLSLMTN